MAAMEPGAGADRRLWTLTDGHAGNVRQAAALAAALGGGVPREWTLRPRAPWRWAAPREWPGSAHAFGADFKTALAAPPALAIGCGRQAALATRLLHARGGRVVQILDPRLPPTHWNLLVVPEHDALRGENVLTLTGSLHPVDDAWLAQARADYSLFASLPRPRTALLLGGPSRHARDEGRFAKGIARLSEVLRREGGSLLATTSRRTPVDWRDVVRRELAHVAGVRWFGDGGADNPYPGLLAWADRIVCTADSVNMVSEACATQVPVYVFDPQATQGRLRRFHDGLLARGRTRVLADSLADYPVEPLRETARIAAEVRVRLRLGD